MRKFFLTTLTLLVAASAVCFAGKPEVKSQWEGKRVAFLGDSITDANQIGRTNDVYWHLMEDILGIKPYSYAINGHKMNQIVGQAERLEAEHGQDVDAIIVFCGTNDYNGNIPMGEWFTYTQERIPVSGNVEAVRAHRLYNFDDTFKGRINTVMKHLKTHFPTKQIIFLTPIHRAYANFGANNVQPNESYANSIGLYVDEYVQAVKEAANIWAVPVIDLNCISGLFPLMDEHTIYFRNAEKDRLHPNTTGHQRMAYAISYQLLGYPATFD